MPAIRHNAERMPQMRHPRIETGALHASSRKCIAARRIKASVLSPSRGNALLPAELKQVHCRQKPKRQYRSQRKGKRTVDGSRKCSTEAREGASVLPQEEEKTVQKSEIKQEHCRQKPKRQYRSQKMSKHTACLTRKCIAARRIEASALSAEAETTVRIHILRQVHCHNHTPDSPPHPHTHLRPP